MPVIALTASLAAGCRCAGETPAPAAPKAARTGQTSEALALSAHEAPLPAGARGLWVWGTAALLSQEDGSATLLASCKRATANEVYLAVNPAVLAHPKLPAMIDALHGAGMRVEALMGDAVWYQPEHEPRMMGAIDAVARFDAQHPRAFTAVHLDVEPHQLPENRGASHAFLPALARALGRARDHAKRSGLSTSADLPRFAFEKEGPAFARAVDRPFVMLYELRDKSPAKLVDASRAVIDRVYASGGESLHGRLVIGIRVEDYGTNLDVMAKALDTGDATSHPSRYGGWAIHDEAKYRALWQGR